MKNPIFLIIRQGASTTKSDFAERLYRRKTRMGEERLMLSILQDAIDCFLNYSSSEGRRADRLFKEAEQWIAEEGGNWIFSFENICWTLGIDATYLRKGLMRWKMEEAVRKTAALGQNLAAPASPKIHQLRPRAPMKETTITDDGSNAPGFMRAIQ